MKCRGFPSLGYLSQLPPHLILLNQRPEPLEDFQGFGEEFTGLINVFLLLMEPPIAGKGECQLVFRSDFLEDGDALLEVESRLIRVAALVGLAQDAVRLPGLPPRPMAVCDGQELLGHLPGLVELSCQPIRFSEDCCSEKFSWHKAGSSKDRDDLGKTVYPSVWLPRSVPGLRQIYVR